MSADLHSSPSRVRPVTLAAVEEVAAGPTPASASRREHARFPELAIVVPTLDERDNIEEFLDRVDRALGDLRWEAIFVDDDSRDGTADLLLDLQARLPNVRAIRRIGRRGLSSACIEGMMATAAPYIAVMDADMQHDETALPAMLRELKQSDLDIVVGTRFADGGSVGEFSKRRIWLSRAGAWFSRLISGADLSDPMSGFFVLRRSFLERSVRRLSGHGFKILLDLFASSPNLVCFAEVPYRFHQRRHGVSKLDMLVMLEYASLLGDKLFGRYLPWRFILFVFVGLLGVLVHLGFLGLFFTQLAYPFYISQIVATFAAMTFNFNLNNVFTYRDRRLRGRRLLYGHLSFYLICSVGAIANLAVAEMLYEFDVPWALAGMMGAIIGAVWNFGVSSTFTWSNQARSVEE